MGVGGEEGGGSPSKDIFLKKIISFYAFPTSQIPFQTLCFGGKIAFLFQLISASSVDFMPYLSIFLPSSLIKCIKALNAKKIMTTFPFKIFHSQMHLKIKARG